MDRHSNEIFFTTKGRTAMKLLVQVEFDLQINKHFLSDGCYQISITRLGRVNKIKITTNPEKYTAAEGNYSTNVSVLT